MKPQELIEVLTEVGVKKYFSVPDSNLNHIYPILGSSIITCSNEGEAVAMAFGCKVSGVETCVMLQNSGLGNAINPLTSLVSTFGERMILIVGYRGAPKVHDEPQHGLMGQITAPLLEMMGFCVIHINKGISRAVLIDRLHCNKRNNLALLVDHDSFDHVNSSYSPDHAHEDDQYSTRSSAIIRISKCLSDDTWVVSSTGKISRELEALNPRKRNLYMVGSMGCAASIAVGISQVSDGDPVCILDGDGSLMMRIESMAQVPNLSNGRVDHVVLDNGVHESTGGQWSTSRLVDLSVIAKGFGYDFAADFDDPLEVGKLITDPNFSGRNFYRLRVSIEDTKNLSRPRVRPIENWDILQRSFGRKK